MHQLTQNPPLPRGFRPEVLRTLTVRALLVVIARYGVEAVAQRVGDDGFVEIVQKVARG